MLTKPVWFWLPGHVKPVQAGVFTLEEGLGRFTYAKEYLDRSDSIPVDPYSLPLRLRGAVETRRGGIFGILRDSGPDSWGRAVLQKEHGRELSEIEILELAPGDSAGAIAVGDPARKQEWKPWKLSDLDAAVDDWDKLQGNGHELARILSPDTGLGGAKPKTTLEHEGELWLAKLPEKGDSVWLPHLEDAALKLARECNIESSESQVKTLDMGRHVLLVKRFDRAASPDGWLRKGFASADTVLRLGDKGIGEPGRNYVAFGQELRRWCAKSGVDAKEQIRELWRRIAFNCFVGNGDDHAKNHGVIQEGENWRLSPAFDIVPHPYSHQQFGLSMPFYLDGTTRSSAVRYDYLVLAASDFGYTREEAVHTLGSMAELIADKWRGYLQDIPASERERMTPAFAMTSVFGQAAKQEIQTGILPERRRSRGVER